ncbi:MAG: FG-GAP repeat protein [Acidimicrobiales bacterium]
MHRPKSMLVALVATSLVGAMFALAPPAAAETIYFCDNNADGSSDLMVGVPREDTQGVSNVGVVHEYLSTSFGLLANRSFEAINEPDQRAGESLICADFDGDSFSDLAIGIPFGDRGGRNTGRVEIIYGSPDGLMTETRPAQVIDQNTPGIRDRAEAGDVFGFDMTWCFFDDDPYADLAIGVPGEDVAGRRDAGAVHVIYGGPDGLSDRDQVFHQNTRGIRDRAEAGDFFGEYLTAADVDGDGACDLVVGIPSEDIGARTDAGAVQVIFGGPDGLTRRNQFLHRNTRGVAGRATAGERFGAPLFFGDFFANQPGVNIVVGVPGQDVAGRRDAGAVHILGTNRRGLTGRGDVVVHQNSPGIRGRAQANDQFGRSVIVGLFDGDQFFDLAVGVPGERVRGQANAGQVQVIFGNGRGLSNRNRVVNAGAIGLRPQRGMFFGATLAGGDFDGDGRTDLAIGAPFADFFPNTGPRRPDVGLVGIVRGTVPGLRGLGAQLLSQGDFSLDGTDAPIEACDNFGNFNPGLALPPPRGVVDRRCAGGRDLAGPVTTDPVPHTTSPGVPMGSTDGWLTAE